MSRITILTPVKNGAAFIEDCVRHVAREARGLDLEHLVVDGASTDGTRELLEHLATSCPHLRFVSRTDSGQSAAMNRGLELARGERIGILNVDDFYEPGAIARACDLLAAARAPGFVLANCNLLDGQGKLLGVNRPGRPDLSRLLRPENEVLMPINPSQYFYDRRVHELVGYFDEREEFLMDVDFYLRVARWCSVEYVDEIWGNFRLHGAGKTGRDRESGSADGRYSDLLARHSREPGIWMRLRKEWRRRRLTAEVRASRCS